MCMKKTSPTKNKNNIETRIVYIPCWSIPQAYMPYGLFEPITIQCAKILNALSVAKRQYSTKYLEQFYL